MSKNKQNICASMRLDKWLCCARFYKTRSLATTAIKEGKIKIDGTKAKPARLIQIKDKIEIRRSPYYYQITIKALAKSRGSATDAALLFHKSEQSIARRKSMASQIKLATTSQDSVSGRPNKQQRRKIIRFTRRPV